MLKIETVYSLLVNIGIYEKNELYMFSTPSVRCQIKTNLRLTMIDVLSFTIAAAKYWIRCMYNALMVFSYDNYHY